MCPDQTPDCRTALLQASHFQGVLDRQSVDLIVDESALLTFSTTALPGTTTAETPQVHAGLLSARTVVPHCTSMGFVMWPLTDFGIFPGVRLCQVFPLPGRWISAWGRLALLVAPPSCFGESSATGHLTAPVHRRRLLPVGPGSTLSVSASHCRPRNRVHPPPEAAHPDGAGCTGQ